MSPSSRRRSTTTRRTEADRSIAGIDVVEGHGAVADQQAAEALPTQGIEGRG